MKNQNNALRAGLVACMALSTAACATVTRGTSQAWTVQTEPSGATVRTSAGFACDATPCTWKMSRKSDFQVTISKAGYKTVQTQVIHQMSGGGGAALAGNVLVGGIIGIGIDAATGAAMELKPNPLIIKLEPEATKVVSADGK